jgi:hypothetical protein
MQKGFYRPRLHSCIKIRKALRTSQKLAILCISTLSALAVDSHIDWITAEQSYPTGPRKGGCRSARYVRQRLAVGVFPAIQPLTSTMMWVSAYA